MNPRITLALLLVGVLALGAIVFAVTAGREDEPVAPEGEFAGATMPDGVRAPDFELRDQDGEPISMRALRGEPVAVTFLYTTCEDTCPLQAQTLRGALDELGRDIPAIAIAVDPPRDTPERARAFLAEQRATGRIRFVLGSRKELRPVWDGFHIQPQTVTQEHQSRFTLVDAKGFQRVGYPGGEATPERLAHDLRLLLRLGD